MTMVEIVVNDAFSCPRRRPLERLDDLAIREPWLSSVPAAWALRCESCSTTSQAATALGSSVNGLSQCGLLHVASQEKAEDVYTNDLSALLQITERFAGRIPWPDGYLGFTRLRSQCAVHHPPHTALPSSRLGSSVKSPVMTSAPAKSAIIV